MNGLKMFSLEGKVALITGGTHGIGMALAKGLASCGAKIAVNDILQEKLDAGKAEYAKDGIQVHTYLCDVTDEEGVNKMIAQIDKELGGVDILVNNAGIIKRVPSMELSLKDWKQVIDIDLTAPFILSKAVAPGMKAKGGGKIINMCSMMSELGRDTVAAYAAAKGGLKMLTRNLATEWARYNIQVNGIGPGYIATSQNTVLRENGHPFNEFIIKRTPAMRWGTTDDLVGGAIFLAGNASDFVNGHVLYIDGGILASLGKASNEE
ncbi:MAG: gluconate 5-dehydrogenase [Rikenellaceae bacterium]|jgi:gluconate 5-dehydrogenase|nr:gluconate 5-dehydrogenase [Rikenellaceae bacterium]